jgi:hypothetical protein
MTPTAPTQDFTSIGCLAGQIQRSVRAIETAATKIGLAPALRLNNVPHFDAGQIERLIAELNRGGK